MKFDDFLEKLESDSSILNFRFAKSQVPMYLIVRFMLIQSLINKEFKLSTLNTQKNGKRLKEILMYVYYTLKLNVFFAPKRDIYIFSSGIVNNIQNSKYVNRLYDEFNTIYKAQTQIIESSTKYSYLFPKKEKIYFKDLIDIIAVLSSKFIMINKKDLDMIDNFIAYLRNTNLFTNELFLDEIKKTLIKYSKKINIYYSIYLYLLKFKKVKLIIVEDAHYFGSLALLKAAKSLGVTTVEYQHGYVGLAHPAYNYHYNMFEAVKEFLPEYFLTYGLYWNSVTRTPSQKFTIGLANLSNQISRYNKLQNKKNKILFISSGTTFEALNMLIEKSLEKLNILGYEILLRPHPIEKGMVKERYLNLINQGVSIDTLNLYDTLEEVDIVVGMEVSTVLYEAFCFTNKIYLMDTEYTRFYEPNFCFLPFKNENELIASIKEERFVEYNSDYFWDSNWELNYKKFIQNNI